MAKYQQGFPVNAEQEIVISSGVGSNLVQEVLSTDVLPVDDSGRLSVVLPEQVITQFSSPSSGSFQVTGNTSAQIFEIADLSGKLKQDCIVNVDATFSYPANTNTKTITFSVGPNTSSLTGLGGTTRTSGTETGMRSLFQFGVVDQNTLFRIATSLGAIGATGSTVGNVSYNTQQNTKLYVTVQLGNAADTLTCNCVTVKINNK